MIMPDYATRRDAFTALLEPEGQHDDDFEISWEKPERFCCDCCGFPTIMYPDRYEMCYVCEWEQEYYPIVTECSGGPNGSYTLFDSRKNFEKYGCMYVPEDDRDFERCMTENQLTYNRQIIPAYFNLLNYKRGSIELKDAWEDFLRFDIDLSNATNTKNDKPLSYESLYKKLHYRDYPIAVFYNGKTRMYQATLPEFYAYVPFEGCSVDDAIRQARSEIDGYMRFLINEGVTLPEPSKIHMHQDKIEYRGCTWRLLKLNHDV